MHLCVCACVCARASTRQTSSSSSRSPWTQPSFIPSSPLSPLPPPSTNRTLYSVMNVTCSDSLRFSSPAQEPRVPLFLCHSQFISQCPQTPPAPTSHLCFISVSHRFCHCGAPPLDKVLTSLLFAHVASSSNFTPDTVSSNLHTQTHFLTFSAHD